MDMGEMLNKAFNIGMTTHYDVKIDSEIKNMTYIELGMLLFKNKDNIELIVIKKRD